MPKRLIDFFGSVIQVDGIHITVELHDHCGMHATKNVIRRCKLLATPDYVSHYAAVRPTGSPMRSCSLLGGVIVGVIVEHGVLVCHHTVILFL